VKTLVEAHGGTTALESEPRKGTTASIRLGVRRDRLIEAATPPKFMAPFGFGSTPTMTRVEKIEKEILALSAEERSALRDWFLARDAEVWDAEIEADAKAGKLDKLAERARTEHRKGQSKPL